MVIKVMLMLPPVEAHCNYIRKTIIYGNRVIAPVCLIYVCAFIADFLFTDVLSTQLDVGE